MSNFLELLNVALYFEPRTPVMTADSSAPVTAVFGEAAADQVLRLYRSGEPYQTNLSLAHSYVSGFCSPDTENTSIFEVDDTASRFSFNVKTGKITIPSRSANPELYRDHGRFYNQLFHEISHYLRSQQGAIGQITSKHSPEYAREEVIAEMTACKMMVNSGFPVQYIQTSAQYIDAWANEYVKDLPDIEREVTKERLIHEAETAADASMKMIHSNIAVNQYKETNQDLKIRLIVPLDESPEAERLGARKDSRGYFIRFTDNREQFAKWFPEETLGSSIRIAEKVVSEISDPELRNPRENDLREAEKAAQNRLAEEAQQEASKVHPRNNADLREEISSRQTEKSNAPNAAAGNSGVTTDPVNGVTAGNASNTSDAAITELQRTIAALQKQIETLQKQNEQKQNGEFINGSKQHTDSQNEDSRSPSGNPESALQQGTGQNRSGGTHADSLGDHIGGASSGSPAGSPDHQQSDVRAMGGQHDGNGNPAPDHLGGQSGEPSGRPDNRSRVDGESRNAQEQPETPDGARGDRAGENRGGDRPEPRDLSGVGDRNSDRVHEAELRESAGNADIPVVDDAGSRSSEESVLPGESDTGSRGQTDSIPRESDDHLTGGERNNGTPETGIPEASRDTGRSPEGDGNQSGIREGRTGMGGGVAAAPRNAGDRVSDGTPENARGESSSGLHAAQEGSPAPGEQLGGNAHGGHGNSPELHDSSRNPDHGPLNDLVNLYHNGQFEDAAAKERVTQYLRDHLKTRPTYFDKASGYGMWEYILDEPVIDEVLRRKNNGFRTLRGASGFGHDLASHFSAFLKEDIRDYLNEAKLAHDNFNIEIKPVLERILPAIVDKARTASLEAAAKSDKSREAGTPSRRRGGSRASHQETNTVSPRNDNQEARPQAAQPAAKPDSSNTTRAEKAETEKQAPAATGNELSKEKFLKHVIYHGLIDLAEMYRYEGNPVPAIYLEKKLRSENLNESIDAIYDSIRNVNSPLMYRDYNGESIEKAVRVVNKNVPEQDMPRNIKLVTGRIEANALATVQDSRLFNNDLMTKKIAELQDLHSGYPTYDQLLESLSDVIKDSEQRVASEATSAAETAPQETEAPEAQPQNGEAEIAKPQGNTAAPDHAAETETAKNDSEKSQANKPSRSRKSQNLGGAQVFDLFDESEKQAEEAQDTPEITESRAAPAAPSSAVSSSPVPEEKPAAAPEAKPEFTTEDNWEITSETEKLTTLERFTANIEAIETLKKIQSENDRPATKEEQEKLAKFSGWGGLMTHFHLTNSSSKADEVRYENLRQLLGNEEFDKAKRSALTAYYTDPLIARNVFKVLEKAGFTGGRILEPSCGTGIFFGTMPRDMMAKSDLTGVELEPITAQIAQKLYPTAHILNSGYEKSGQANNTYDVVIGNVPFGKFSVNDPHYMKDHDYIHNYFINKSIDQVKEGGIVALITSSQTMEDSDPAFRRKIAEKAELLGGVRLPDTAFEKTGTDIKTDILIFKKRRERITAEEAAKETWVNKKTFVLDTEASPFNRFNRESVSSGEISASWLRNNFYGDLTRKEWEKELPKINLSLNAYYQENPDMIVGGYDGLKLDRYGKLDFRSGHVEDLNASVESSLSKISGAFEAEKSDITEQPNKFKSFNYPDVKYYSYFMNDGKAYFKNAEYIEPVSEDNQPQVKKFIELKDAFQKVIQANRDYSSDEALDKAQRDLRTKYEELRKMSGMNTGVWKQRPLFDNRKTITSILKQDVDFGKIKVLENTYEKFEENNGKTKAVIYLKGLSDIFTKRIFEKETAVQAGNAQEALLLCLGNKGKIDFDYMSSIMPNQQSADSLIDELSKSELIFRDPAKTGSVYENWIPREEFLSGDIQLKMEQVKERINDDVSFTKEFEALKKVLPKEKKFDELDINISSPFVPTDILESFLNHEFGTWGAMVTRKLGKVEVTFPNLLDKSREDSYTVSDKLKISDFVEGVINHKVMKIKKNEKEFDKEAIHTVNNVYRKRLEESFNQFKAELDSESRIRIENNYNHTLNRMVPRSYDGSVLKFTGMNKNLKLRTHQANGVAKCIFGGNTLLAHEVGAGKTFTMAATAMEMKRMGVCKKPVFAVPGAVVAQWGKEFQQLYPNANILTVKKDDMSKDHISATIGKMAFNNWDAIIMSHEAFNKIPVSQEVIDKIKNEKLATLKELSHSVGRTIRDGETWLVKQEVDLETTFDSISQKYQKSGCPMTMDEIGIDRLFVDESHNYKNLKLDTTLTQIVGLNTNGAVKAQDMELKTAYLNQETNYKGVVFASGTPVSNTLGELYTIQKYLQPKVLQNSGCYNFDIWANNFVNIDFDKQVKMTGNDVQIKLQFKEFKNLDGLLNQFWQCGDFVTTKSLVGKEGFVLPEVKREAVLIEPTESQNNLITKLTQRMAAVEARQVAPEADNKLCIASDARKIGLDPRLLSKSNLERMDLSPAQAGYGNKLETVADNVSRIWKETAASRSTQVLFSDLGTPKKGEFNVYDGMKDLLMQRGVAEKEIAFIHDFDTDEKKKSLFERLNAGDIRIVIGSTQKLGTGCNFQKKLIAAHHIDAPWRPSDFTQREGRIVRQGNENKTVQIYTYSTKKTFDAYMFDMLARKQEYVTSIFSGKEKSQRVEDVGGIEMNYKEMRTLTCGNEKLKQKLDLMDRLEQYKMSLKFEKQKLNHLSQDILLGLPNRIEACKLGIKNLQQVSELISKYPVVKNDKNETVFPGFEKGDGQLITDKKEFMQFLENSPTNCLIGKYRGFPVYMFHVRDNTGQMARRTAIAPSELSGFNMMNYGRDQRNTTLIYAGLTNNWDQKISKFEFDLKEHEKELAKLEHELKGSDVSQNSIKKEIEHYESLIAACEKELSSLESIDESEVADLINVENADTDSLKDVDCDVKEVEESLKKLEDPEDEESEEKKLEYSLPHEEPNEAENKAEAEKDAENKVRNEKLFQEVDFVPEIEDDRKNFIDVPYRDKDKVKALGAKWDIQNKSWFIPAGLDKSKFAEWQPKERKEPEKRDYIKVPKSEKDEAKALGARWDSARKSWFIPAGVPKERFAKWPAAAPENNKEAKQENFGPKVYLHVAFSDKDTVKAMGAKWDIKQKQWYCRENQKEKFSAYLNPLPKESNHKPLANTDYINREPNAQAAMLRDLAAAGVRITDISIRNCSTLRVPLIDDKPGEKTGSLTIHLDGVPNLKFTNFRHPELSIPSGNTQTARVYVGDLEKTKQVTLTSAQELKNAQEKGRELIKAQAEEKQKERESQAKQAQKKSAYFKTLPLAAEDSPYLVNKGIKPTADLHQNKATGDLFVPFYAADGTLKTTQIIHQDARKQFIEHGEMKGSFHPLDGMDSLKTSKLGIYICEGYATASTIREATKGNVAVVSAANCGNLKEVAVSIHAMYPDKPIVICGDDDRHNTVNSGRSHAEAAALAVGGTAVFPVFDEQSRGTDFNDMASEKGIESVREVLRNQYRLHRAAGSEGHPEIPQAGRSR